MNIQAQLNKSAFEKLKKTSEAINNASSFSVSQMQHRVLQELDKSKVALDDMSNAQKAFFDAKMIAIFKLRNWC